MNGTCDELLAGTILTKDEHIGVGFRNLVDDVKNTRHRLAGADDILKRLLNIMTELALTLA